MASGKHSRKKERTHTRLWIGLVGALTLAMAAAGFVFVSHSHNTSASATTAAPPTPLSVVSTTPTGVQRGG